MAFKALKGLKISKKMYQSMPYVAFLGILAMVYIANAHRGETVMRSIQQLEDQAKEDRWRYMSIKSDVTEVSVCSKIENQVADQGLKVPVVPPRTISVE